MTLAGNEPKRDATVASIVSCMWGGGELEFQISIAHSFPPPPRFLPADPLQSPHEAMPLLRLRRLGRSPFRLESQTLVALGGTQASFLFVDSFLQ